MQTIDSQKLKAFSQLTYTFTSRRHGLSKAPFDTNNLAFHVGDDADLVRQNHLLLARELDYDLERLVHMRQIHSDIIVVVDPEVDNFENPPECDALITDRPDIPLMVMTADCTPVLLFDPVRNVIAVAHAGRAGAVKGIVPKTIEKMCSDFASRVEDIAVVLGPSIGGCCYEVGEKIVQEVTKEGYGFAVIAKEGRYFLEVNAIIKKQLEVIGIQDENLEELNICNACENETFFSYRADHQKTGRIAGVLMLKQP